MISNDADRTTCVACEAPKPGYKPPAAAKDPAKKDSAQEFKFGFNGSQTKAEEVPESDFKFGTSGSGSGGVFGGFKTGTSTETESKPTEGFKFGSSTDVESKPTDGFKFGASADTETKPTLASSASDKPPTDDLFAKFMQKSSGKWTCDICMISNDADRTTCVACEAPKPGYTPTAAAKDPAKKDSAQEMHTCRTIFAGIKKRLHSLQEISHSEPCRKMRADAIWHILLRFKSFASILQRAKGRKKIR